ncbi:MAG: type I methionyl aminopeptidase, partial [Bacteroidetes bacterium]|nr:type I methionyl aminopeptidase [Bacteroidota bacterium]
LILEKGGRPSFKGYGNRKNPYPSTLCVSVNNEVVHGIPAEDKKFKEGDIVSLDIGMQYPAKGGMYTDMAKTIAVGKTSKQVKKLIKTTQESLENGIAKCRSGNLMSQVSAAIQQTAEKEGYSLVRSLAGHGVGKQVHEDPQIPNYVSDDADIILKPGMTLALEPMVNIGDYQVELLEDGWTFVTCDSELSAHFEHTVLVTEGDPEVLTIL